MADPVIVFEVFCDGTADEDLFIKNAEYRATPSIQRDVVLQQTRPGAILFVRKSEDWITEIVSGAQAELDLPEAGITIPLAELYADLDLNTEDQSRPTG